MTRDPYSLQRVYRAGSRDAGSCRALFDAVPGLSRRLDGEMIRAALGGSGAPDRTAFEAIRPAEPVAVEPRRGDLAQLLDAAVAGILATAPRPLAVALSGGLDSALVLALARRHEPAIRAVVLDPRLPGYSEVDEALATAAALGVAVDVVPASEDDFVAALPAAIAAFEQPLYNLHPVAKLLLARAAARLGLKALLTGDGADQVVTRDVSADYLPLVGAAFDACGVAACSPFLAAPVVAHLLAIPPDRDKRALRDVAAPLAIPRPLVDEPKRGRFAPPMELGSLVSPARMAEVAAAFGHDVSGRTSDVRGPDTSAGQRARVVWATTGLLADAFEVPL